MNQPDSVADQRILADFRAWLEALRAFDPSSPELVGGGSVPSAAPVDLATLVGQFVALKQEVNLQTRASRGQLEQNVQALEQLRQSLSLLERQQEGFADDQDETLRPLLKSLVETHDALALARREVARIQESLQRLLDQRGADAAQFDNIAKSAFGPPPVIKVRLPWWARLLRLDWQAEKALARYNAWCAEQQQKMAGAWQAVAAEQQARIEKERADLAGFAERVRQGVQSILTGYGMSVQRIERVLVQHGLEPILAAGQTFDPERMEALELVRDTGRPTGEVAEEVRRGYLWHGKVFRFAQVRVCQ